MLHVALEIPLPTFHFSRLFERDNACAPRVKVFHKALDGTALARRISPLEQDHHLLAGFLDPGLQFEQLDLQPIFLALIVAALHQVAIRVASLTPVRHQLVIRVAFVTRSRALLPQQGAQQDRNLLTRRTGNDVAHGREASFLRRFNSLTDSKGLYAGLARHRPDIALGGRTGFALRTSRRRCLGDCLRNVLYHRLGDWLGGFGDWLANNSGARL
jgi:hypothetical protein